MFRNNTNFPLALRANVVAKTPKNEFLRPHQYAQLKFIQQNPEARGLVMVVKMGYGKSISAAAITRFWKEEEPSRKVIVLLAKSLAANFVGNIEKYLSAKGMSQKEIQEEVKKYNFVSYNASNMFAQVERTSDKKITLEDRLGKMDGLIQKDKQFLEGSVLVVDEAHNFFNSITNGSKNALRLYDAIMRTKDIKLLFLTGTPIVNNPFELVPCFNMLGGQLLFPEEREKFENYFVDRDIQRIKNAGRFQNRIIGLLSYYGDYYFGKGQKDFPELKGPIIEKVIMSNPQFLAYDKAREAERAEPKFGVQAGGRFSSSDSTSSYRIKSRQISNFFMPEHALGPQVGKRARKVLLNKLTDKDLKDLGKYSPKMERLMKNIKKNKKNALIYSEFVSRDQAIIRRLLEMEGYVNFLEENAFGIKQPIYASYTGQVSVEDRANIAEAFNADKIDVLLISKAGAEGLDLKGVREIHILEPYWHNSRNKQIYARGVRYKSHSHLPAKDRNVTAYMYIADYPPGVEVKEPTTDNELYNNSMKGEELAESFIRAMVGASIDCHAHNPKGSKIKCRMCDPDNKRMFLPDLDKDMLRSDPCKAVVAADIVAKEIVFDGTGETFYYTVEKSPLNVKIYMFDKQLNGHVIMPGDHPYHGSLFRKIMETEK